MYHKPVRAELGYSYSDSTSHSDRASARTIQKVYKHIFFRRDPDLLRASETLRKWAIGQTTDEEQNWLENFFMKLFQDYFTPVDCPQITWEDLDFNYYGDGSFEPDSIQGVIAETAGETQIKWTFKIAPDGSNQILTIDYDGDHQFDTSNNYEPLS